MSRSQLVSLHGVVVLFSAGLIVIGCSRQSQSPVCPDTEEIGKGFKPLEPVLTYPGVAAGYAQLQTNLLADAPPYRYAQMLARPSFGAEEVVYVVEDNTTEAFQVVYVQGKRKESGEWAGIAQYKAPIPKVDVDFLRKLWGCAGRGAKYPPMRLHGGVHTHTVISDGTRYQFSSYERNLGYVGAETHEPAHGSFAHQMIAVGRALASVALADTTRRAAARKSLLRAAQSAAKFCSPRDPALAH